MVHKMHKTVYAHADFAATPLTAWNLGTWYLWLRAKTANRTHIHCTM